MKANRFILMLLVELFVSSSLALAQGIAHRVTLNPNSGIVTPGTIELDEGQRVGDLPTPTRDGFTFVGWYSIPGNESTRVTNRSIYSYSQYNDIFHARWTKKVCTLVLMNYDGTQEIGRVNVSGQGGSLVDIPASTYKLSVGDDEYFAGYYTRINGEGERIYDGVEEGGDLHAAFDGECPFTQNTTLYAFKTHVKHTVHWDYTYAGGNQNWINLNQDDETARSKYGKLTFMDNAGTVLKWVYFQAADVTNKKAASLNDQLSSHTTTVGQFHLQLADETNAETPNGTTVAGTKSDDGDAGFWNVYFTDEQLSQFTQYNFQPILTPANEETESSATNWLRTTDRDSHDTWFTFTGGETENNAELPWTVSLTNMKFYPENIIVKPLYWNDESKTWSEVSQLASLEGVTCHRASVAQDGTSATYTGSYPAWKNGSSGNKGYAIGIVGFDFNGQKLYLNQTIPGRFDESYNSASSTNGGDTKTSVWDDENLQFPQITYSIDAPSIPVVRFMPGSIRGAKLDGATPEILVGSVGQTISDFCSTYFAVCLGYEFLGWSETDGATTPTYTKEPASAYTFSGAMTLYPVFKFMPHEHNYSAEWSVDETHHWHACTSEDGGYCAAPRTDEAEHCTPNILNDQANYHCDVCGYTDEALKAEYDARDYLSMTAVGGDVTIGFNKVGNPANYTIQVSEDGNIWSEPMTLSTVTALTTIPEGKTYYFRHGSTETIDKISSGDNTYWSFTMDGSGTIEAGGNVMSLLDMTCKKNSLKWDIQHVFTKLFLNCERLTVAPKVPVTNLGQWCYVRMFAGSGITAIPELPATHIQDGSYRAMFEDCKNLVTTPYLPATRLNRCAYKEMFKGCEKLTSVKIANITSVDLRTDASNASFYNWLEGTAADTNGKVIAPIDMMGHSLVFLPPNWQWATKLKANEDPTIGEEGNFYTTFYDSRYDYKVEEGFKAYTGSINGTELRLTATPGNIIPKGDGVLIHGGSGEVLLTVSDGSAQKVDGNVLTGSDTDTTAPADCYILSYGQNGLGFYQYAAGKAISAHKAYLIKDSSAPLRMVFTGNVSTEIKDVNDNVNENIYSLQGVRLNSLHKGINIVGGKKVIR